MSTKQQTLKAPISFSGKGLHTGVKVTMTVNPADADTGIVFRRTDIEGQPIIPALCDNVVDTSRGTTIESGGHRVSTIEHIMSALWTLGVDNAVIDIDAGETPIMDGSACAYAKAITEVGITDQPAERKFYHVTEKMVYTIPEKGVAIILYPDDEFSVSLHVDYNSKVIGNQYATFNPGDNFADKIAPCRTFVFLHELEPLMKMNLIKGGDLDNAIVVVENPVPDDQLEHLKKIFNKPDIEINAGYLNNLELRCNNELARHKLLDLLGDFALLGQDVPPFIIVRNDTMRFAGINKIGLSRRGFTPERIAEIHDACRILFQSGLHVGLRRGRKADPAKRRARRTGEIHPRIEARNHQTL